MGVFDFKNGLIRKIIATTVILFYLCQVNLFSYAGSSHIPYCSESNGSLQVGSFFQTGKYMNRLRTEFRFIREILADRSEVPSYREINALLDECYDGYGRILSLKKTPVVRRDAVKIELEILNLYAADAAITKKIRSFISSFADDFDEGNNTITITYRNKRPARNNYISDDHGRTEKFITSFDGAKIAYNVTGKGEEIIVLVHYWGGKKEQWDRFLEVILKKSFFRKYTVLTLDLRGFGSSELKGCDWNKNKDGIMKLFKDHRFLQSLYVRYCVRDIKLILDREKLTKRKGFQGVNLMGHSLGGIVSMQFALDFPEYTKSLALIHTSSDPIHTFSPVTFLPGSTWAVKQILRALARITEKLFFVYEDLYSMNSEGIEKFGNALKRIYNSTDYKLVRSVLKIIPGSNFVISKYIGYSVQMSQEIALLHSGLFEDLLPRKFVAFSEDIRTRAFDVLKKTVAFSWLLESILLDGKDEEAVDEIIKAFEEVRLYVLVHTFFALTFVDFPGNVLEEKLRCPVLVVRGMKDLVTGRESFWAKPIKGLRRLAILLGKHMGPQEYPRDLADIVGWFLRTGETGGVEDLLSMDPETEEKILSGKRVKITGRRARKIVLKKEDGIYDIDDIGPGMADIKRSLILLMEKVNTEVSSELYQAFTHKSILDYFPVSKGGLGKGDNYLCVKGGELVGFLNFTVKGSRGKYTVNGRLAILPQKQDEGLGYALLDHAISASREKYNGFNGFRLLLAPQAKTYFNKYFERRAKNKKGTLEFYLEAEALEPEDPSHGFGFGVKINEYTLSDKLLMAENTIKNSNKYSDLLLNSILESSDRIMKDDVPVDVIVDLSLFSSDDCKPSMETWAHLILKYSKLENINFIFRDPRNMDIFDSHLKYEIFEVSNMPSLKNAVSDLRGALYKNAGTYSVDKAGLEDIFDRCIHEDRRENAIVLPIVSKSILNAAVREELKLKKDVFPVAMDGAVFDAKTGAVLRNYQGALTIALAKAVLAIARKDGEEELGEVVDELFPRIHKLFKSIKNIDITEADLIYMVDSNPVQRIRFAIELSLPEIIRMPYDKIPELHEAVQTYLKYS